MTHFVAMVIGLVILGICVGAIGGLLVLGLGHWAMFVGMVLMVAYAIGRAVLMYIAETRPRR